jgi:hypothetical protein
VINIYIDYFCSYLIACFEGVQWKGLVLCLAQRRHRQVFGSHAGLLFCAALFKAPSVLCPNSARPGAIQEPLLAIVHVGLLHVLLPMGFCK